MWYEVHRALLRAWMRFAFRFWVEGEFHEPEAPYLIIANHCSTIDPPLVAAAVRAPVRFLCHQDLARNPLKWLWIRSLGGFFIRPGNAVHGAIPTALRYLEQGKVVCIFPEGTRSRDGRLLSLRTGAAHIALAAGVPVLPVAIIGAHLVMPIGRLWPRSARAHIRVGPPLMPPKFGSEGDRSVVRAWTARFAAALHDLLPPDQQPAARPSPVRVPEPAMVGFRTLLHAR